MQNSNTDTKYKCMRLGCTALGLINRTRPIFIPHRSLLHWSSSLGFNSSYIWTKHGTSYYLNGIQICWFYFLLYIFCCLVVTDDIPRKVYRCLIEYPSWLFLYLIFSDLVYYLWADIFFGWGWYTIWCGAIYLLTWYSCCGVIYLPSQRTTVGLMTMKLMMFWVSANMVETTQNLYLITTVHQILLKMRTNQINFDCVFSSVEL